MASALGNEIEEEDFEQEEIDEELKKPRKLQNSWRFYHESVPAEGTNWGSGDHIKEICSFTTIQEFWSCFNNLLPSLSVLKTKESFHMMRKNEKGGIKPLWEDEENAKGGEWVFRISKAEAVETWQNLVLAVIGEQFSDVLDTEDELCGISVSVRPLDYVFQIWNKKAESTKLDALLQKIKETIAPTQFSGQNFYKPHKMPAASTAAATTKK